MRQGDTIIVRRLEKPFKYLAVGLSGVAVNEAGLWFALNPMAWSKEYALGFGIELSILSNYLLNNFWTFREVSDNRLSRFLLRGLVFNMVCLTGAVINYAVALIFLHTFSGNIYLANLVGIGFATIWNFSMNFQVTWKVRW